MRCWASDAVMEVLFREGKMAGETQQYIHVFCV